MEGIVASVAAGVWALPNLLLCYCRWVASSCVDAGSGSISASPSIHGWWGWFLLTLRVAWSAALSLLQTQVSCSAHYCKLELLALLTCGARLRPYLLLLDDGDNLGGKQLRGREGAAAWWLQSTTATAVPLFLLLLCCRGSCWMMVMSWAASSCV